MAYTKVTNVTNFTALLGYLSTFISGLPNWTIDLNLITPTVDAAPPNEATGVVLAAHNTAGVNFAMRSTDTGPGANALYLFDGYGTTPATNETNTPNNSGRQITTYTTGGIGSTNPTTRGFQQLVGPYPTLYLFSDAAGSYVHVVLEWQTGKFRHLHLGMLTQYGTWTGGQYYSGMYWNQGGLNNAVSPNPISYANSPYHYVPWDNGTTPSVQGWTVHYPSPTGHEWIGGNAQSTYNSVVNDPGYGSVRGGFNRAFRNIGQSSFSGLVPLAPIVIGAVRLTDSPNTIRYIGELPDLRMVNMTNLSDAQEFSIGTDTWKVFSVASKNGAAGQENSGVLGFAYKKI